MKPGGGTDNGIVTTERFPIQHQLDFSASWKYVPKNKGYIGHVGLSMLNLYDQKNVIGQARRPQPSGFVYFNKYSLGFSPNLQLSLDF